MHKISTLEICRPRKKMFHWFTTFKTQFSLKFKNITLLKSGGEIRNPGEIWNLLYILLTLLLLLLSVLIHRKVHFTLCGRKTPPKTTAETTHHFDNIPRAQGEVEDNIEPYNNGGYRENQNLMGSLKQEAFHQVPYTKHWNI